MTGRRLLPRFNDGVLILLHVWGIPGTWYDSPVYLQALAEQFVRFSRLQPVGYPAIRALPSGGTYLFQALSESHLCFETWEEDRALVIEVYSCRYLDPQAVRAWFEKRLLPERTHLSILGGPDGFFRVDSGLAEERCTSSQR
jgi:hypothetical protein